MMRVGVTRRAAGRDAPGPWVLSSNYSATKTESRPTYLVKALLVTSGHFHSGFVGRWGSPQRVWSTLVR